MQLTNEVEDPETQEHSIQANDPDSHNLRHDPRRLGSPPDAETGSNSRPQRKLLSQQPDGLVVDITDGIPGSQLHVPHTPPARPPSAESSDVSWSGGSRSFRAERSKLDAAKGMVRRQKTPPNLSPGTNGRTRCTISGGSGGGDVTGTDAEFDTMSSASDSVHRVTSPINAETRNRLKELRSVGLDESSPTTATIRLFGSRTDDRTNWPQSSFAQALVRMPGGQETCVQANVVDETGIGVEAPTQIHVHERDILSVNAEPDASPDGDSGLERDTSHFDSHHILFCPTQKRSCLSQRRCQRSRRQLL